MQPRESEPSRRKQDRRRLPIELTGLLPREFEQGLDHVVRRRILRALHGRPQQQASPVDLSRAELADEALTSVAYHTRVLDRCGLVEPAGTVEHRNYRRTVYASAVQENAAVLTILAQTQGLDAPKRNAGDDGDR